MRYNRCRGLSEIDFLHFAIFLTFWPLILRNHYIRHCKWRYLPYISLLYSYGKSTRVENSFDQHAHLMVVKELLSLKSLLLLMSATLLALAPDYLLRLL